MSNKELKTRIQLKNDTASNWDIASTNGFIPKLGEPIFYREEGGTIYGMKMGDGIHTPKELAFMEDLITILSSQVMHEQELLSDILDSYIFNIDYNSLLAFDTSEIIFGSAGTTSILGQAILGQMILGGAAEEIDVIVLDAAILEQTRLA